MSEETRECVGVRCEGLPAKPLKAFRKMKHGVSGRSNKCMKCLYAERKAMQEAERNAQWPEPSMSNKFLMGAL